MDYYIEIQISVLMVNNARLFKQFLNDYNSNKDDSTDNLISKINCYSPPTIIYYTHIKLIINV
jgi:hypothetical protein